MSCKDPVEGHVPEEFVVVDATQLSVAKLGGGPDSQFKTSNHPTEAR